MTLPRQIGNRTVRPVLMVIAIFRSLFYKRGTPQEAIPFEHPGWRSRLALATLIFSAFWSARAATPQPAQKPTNTKDNKPPPNMTCYKPAAFPPPEHRTPTPSYLQTLRIAWLVLDPNKGETFRQKVEQGIANGQFTRNIGELLMLAYKEMSYHKARTNPERPGPTCYQMTGLGSVFFEARDSALKQIELLRKASKEGKLDETTVQKVKQTLARDLDLLKNANQMSKSDKQEKSDSLIKDYHSIKQSPTSQALEAAAVIVEMEKGS